MSNRTSQMLTRQIDAQAEHFDEIYASIDPFDELWETPLEVTTRAQLVVVLAVGGPHVEAVADLDEDGAVVSAHITGFWGEESEGERSRSRLSSPAPSLCCVQ